MTTQNAVLMLVFNRPDVTEQVFQAVRQARPPRLYVAADGPRSSRPDDRQTTAQVREVFAHVDWPCEVHTRFLEENLGCRNAVSSAIDWFFEHEEQGIILEDDVLPSPAFFPYCDTMLERYKDDERVFSVVGNNLVEPWYKHAESYFFSKVFFVWGWASWRRAWQHYDVNMASWPTSKKQQNLLQLLPTLRLHAAYWKLVFDLAYKNQISTWDHQWTYTHWENQALCVTPAQNLVRNIGFGGDATHTSGSDPEYIKRLQVAPQINTGDTPAAVTDNVQYYEHMSQRVLGISVLTWIRLSLRRFPKFFSQLKKLSNKLRAA
ncbi:glycosyltransferase family 2 protein [Limnobacter sp.]|uniref:glycosyltransferase family 2 protein n=1 Tax=Limnobacter sp. TaxID=2003368 RepID=UPI00273633E8|nr:glycosyltransferase family 2 protein [Limnobacter sp.]MDP3189154.1 glycosyltransferase family 2 protein [Limnobacter sp.]